MKSIQRVTKSEFVCLGDPQIPVVVTDATQDWPGGLAWTPCFIKDVVGHREVNVSISKQVEFAYSSAVEDAEVPLKYELQRTTLAEAADLVMAGKSDRYAYVMQMPLDELSELNAQFERPDWITPEAKVAMWFGAKSVTPLHYDPSHNAFFQVHGSKSIKVFSPQATRFVRPFPLVSAMSHISRLDLEDQDQLERLDSQVEGYSVVLEAGEMLYTPAFWWHHVKSAGPSISLSFWSDVKDIESWIESP